MAVLKLKADKYAVTKGAVRVGVLNIMPNKEQTEAQYRSLFAMSDTLVDLIWIRQMSHTSKHVDENHLETHYLTYREASEIGLDALIITGAPIEQMPFENVTYWKELQGILDAIKEKHIPTLFVCWASQAALYHYYHIDKEPLPTKMFGIFSHRICGQDPLLEGETDPIFAPHSRHTMSISDHIRRESQLQILLESDEAGIFMIKDIHLPFYYISGHLEYDLEALHREYWRDVRKGLDIELPKAYYLHNDPERGIEDTWQGSAARIADRWIKCNILKKRRTTAHAVV